MPKRFLLVLAVSAFVLTLLIAVAAGAQNETTSTSASGGSNGGGGGLQVQQQNQQVQAQDVQTQAQGCRDPRTVVKTGRQNGKDTEKFNTDGDKFRVTYNVTFNNKNNQSHKFTVEITQGSKKIESNTTETNVDNRSFTVNDGPGEFTLDTTTVQGVDTYSLTVQDCRSDASNNNNNGGGHNGGGHNGGSHNGTGTVSPAQNGTSGSTGGATSSSPPAASSASPSAGTTTADNAGANNAGANTPNSDNFRCESFLRTVSDNNGALKSQYKANQSFEHRFQQCLSGNVLTNTIPNRNLPFTGGIPLIALAAFVLIALGVGATAFRTMVRRER